MSAQARSAWHCAAQWSLLAAGLNLVWEIAQLPLYTVYETGTAASIAFAVVHCTIRNVLTALGCYGAAALVTRNMQWPLDRPVLGSAIAIPIGVVYTAFSEWPNVSIRGSWEYATAMPTLYGIGVSPLLQWLFIPALMGLLARRLL